MMATVLIQRRKPDPGKKGKTRYIVYYKDPFTYQSKYYKSFKRKIEAERAANKLRDLIDNGQYSEIKKRKTRVQPLRFKEVASQRAQDWFKKFKRKELSQATIDDYKVRLDVLNRTFGEKLLFEISRKALADHQQKLFDEYSPATSNRYMFIMKQVFKKGIEIGAIINDHAKGIKYFSEKQHERNNFLEPLDLEKLAETSLKNRSKFYMPALIYLGAEHATSKQEALSLEWDKIKFDAEGCGIISLFRTKNSRERTEFLMPRTKEALLKWKAHLKFMRHRKRIKVKDDRYVFCRLDGTPIKRFDKAWRSVCKMAGFEDFHYHDLRHTFCSNLIMSGADLKETRDMIGHSDITMTDRYTHLTALHKKGLQDRLAKRYSQST